MIRGASIIEVYYSIALKVLADCCVDTLLNSVMGHQKVCTIFDIPRAGTETSLGVISSIIAEASIVSSSIRIFGWANQEGMTSLINVASVRLIHRWRAHTLQWSGCSDGGSVSG